MYIKWPLIFTYILFQKYLNIQMAGDLEYQLPA